MNALKSVARTQRVKNNPLLHGLYNNMSAFKGLINTLEDGACI